MYDSQPDLATADYSGGLFGVKSYLYAKLISLLMCDTSLRQLRHTFLSNKNKKYRGSIIARCILKIILICFKTSILISESFTSNSKNKPELFYFKKKKNADYECW